MGKVCAGGLHFEQCRNVTSAVERNHGVEYGEVGQFAWKAGRLCRDITEICSNAGSIKVAGDFAATGLFFVCLGQVTLLAYVFLGKKRDMGKFLHASLASFVVAWLALLIGWWAFAAATDQSATCVVQDVSKTGAVRATGRFGDIINEGGSYTFGFVIGAWLLLPLTIALIVQHHQGPG